MKTVPQTQPTCPECGSHEILEMAVTRTAYPVLHISAGSAENGPGERGPDGDFDGFRCRNCGLESNELTTFEPEADYELVDAADVPFGSWVKIEADENVPRVLDRGWRLLEMSGGMPGDMVEMIFGPHSEGELVSRKAKVRVRIED